MKPILIVSEQELIDIIKLDRSVIEAIEQGFGQLQKGNVTVPPIMMIPVPEKEGEVDIKSAFIKGISQMAIKVASGFFQNQKLGLPSASGQMLVISTETGFLDAVLLDNGYLTQVRTGAAGAVASKYLAPKNISSVGIIGSGTQARYQLRALKIVRSFDKAYMFSLDPEEKRDEYINEMQAELGIEIIKAETAEEVVRSCQIVVTTTPARKGYIQSEWLHPGLHITAMGSDTEEKQELDSSVLEKADILACDLRSQVFRLGEMRSGLKDGVITEDSPITELGEIINGGSRGRQNEDQITICDLTGVGVQDTMIAIMAYEGAVNKGAGIQIPR